MVDDRRHWHGFCFMAVMESFATHSDIAAIGLRPRDTAPRSFRPPLRALLAFEAAARLGSFNKAAQELNLTPSAISHQIIGLERVLGLELFARIGRGVSLTARGTQYYEKIRRILATLEEATREIANASDQELITIRTPPSLATKWLIPLLPRFMEQYPEIDVRVHAETGRLGFGWEAADLAILYGDVTTTDRTITPLLREIVRPLCSPSLLEGRPVRTPADLSRYLLIHTNYNFHTWFDWFFSHDLRGFKDHRRIQIDPSTAAIDAAVQGLGIILESDVLTRDEVATGKLVCPFPDDHGRTRQSYHLAWAPLRSTNRSVALIRDWLIETAKTEAR